MRFIHAADFHLGKPYGAFDEDTRAPLRAARLEALAATGELAVDLQARFVTLAGDTFDAEAPPSRLVKRALETMAAFSDITWVWMPGNHDSLAAIDLWERLARDKPANVILATAPEVISIADDVAILPAPPSVRAPGYDLTDWMTGAETGARLRIGLAHGGVRDFGSHDGNLATIPPNRAEQSQLDYLALGDWHGQMQISPRCWYAGTPETDAFKQRSSAGVLLVEIDARGAPPRVTPQPLSRFAWHQIDAVFFPDSDPLRVLREALPDGTRAQMLVRLSATGRLGLADLADLRVACEMVADEFHFFAADLEQIGIEQSTSDLDVIAQTGALRVAAERIYEATSLEGRTPEDARIAQRALSHLFHLAQEIEP